MEESQNHWHLLLHSNIRVGESSFGSGSIDFAIAKGPMDHFMFKKPKKIWQKKRKETIENKKNVDNRIRDRMMEYIACWFYQAEIPFNAIKLKSFDPMIEAITQYGPSLQPPYHKLRVPLLDKEL